MITLLRGLAIFVGVAAIGSVTYGTVEATGGIGTHTAPLYIALGGLQIVLAMAFGIMPSATYKFLGMLVLIACEVATFIGTANLQLAEVEAKAAPVHDAAAKRKGAEDWVARLERDDRVQRAEEAATRARTDAMQASTAKDCGKVCKATLAKAVDDAAAAVSEARRTLQLEQDQARTALANAPLPGPQNALADKLGLSPDTVDLFFVGFRGFAVSIGAAILLAIGAHPGRRQSSPKVEPSKASPEAPVNGKAPTVTIEAPPRKLARFMLDKVEAAPRSTIEANALYRAFNEWCATNQVAALPAQQFGAALLPLMEETGITHTIKGDEVHLVGVRLAI